MPLSLLPSCLDSLSKGSDTQILRALCWFFPGFSPLSPRQSAGVPSWLGVQGPGGPSLLTTPHHPCILQKRLLLPLSSPGNGRISGRSGSCCDPYLLIPQAFLFRWPNLILSPAPLARPSHFIYSDLWMRSSDQPQSSEQCLPTFFHWRGKSFWLQLVYLRLQSIIYRWAKIIFFLFMEASSSHRIMVRGSIKKVKVLLSPRTYL